MGLLSMAEATQYGVVEQFLGQKRGHTSKIDLLVCPLFYDWIHRLIVYPITIDMVNDWI